MPVLYNPQYGVQWGVLYGPGGDLITRDGPNGWMFPDTGTQYLSLGQPQPTSLYRCQEASGNLLDSQGVLNLIAAGAPTYRNDVTGFNRKAIGFTDASTDAFTVAAGSGPIPTTTSTWWFAVVDFLANPAAVRQFLSAGGAAGASEQTMRIGTTGLAVAKSGGNSTSSVNNAVSPGVIAVALMHNRAAGPLLRLYTNSEIVNVTYVAATDGGKGFGNILTTAPGARLLYSARWDGTNAELSDAQSRARFNALGISVPW